MRIIDADRAKEIAEVSLPDIFLQTATKLLIDKIPTMDAAPVVHGHWALYPDWRYLRCSNCKVEFKEAYFPKTKNYCPNCGAKMDGERKDNV